MVIVDDHSLVVDFTKRFSSCGKSPAACAYLTGIDTHTTPAAILKHTGLRKCVDCIYLRTVLAIIEYQNRQCMRKLLVTLTGTYYDIGRASEMMGCEIQDS